MVRRASLIFSLTLIVAIAVGYLARRSEIANERDARLVAAADVGAARLAGIIESVEVAANAGSAADQTAQSVAFATPSMGVCAISSAETVCSGEGPQPDQDVITAERRLRPAATAAGERAVARVDAYDLTFTVRATGPTVSVIAKGPIDVIGSGSEIAVWAATFLPAGTEVDQFAVDRGIRQTATPVRAATPLYAVAAADDAVSLPEHEQRFYIVIFGLAVALLLLAGATLVVEQRNLLERASFDQLTRLPNRSEFERRAQEAIAAAERQEAGVCLLLFDLNGFKQVNDTYGHFAGDEMLKVVGTRLRKAVREGDVVARWGGDEFVVVMPGIATDEMGSKRATQLAEQVAGRTRLEGVGEALRVKVSVGVAIWPRHGTDLGSLVEAADKAMYHAKREGLTARIADELPRSELPPHVTV